jgi:phosphoribosylanthranilate isomerase
VFRIKICGVTTVADALLAAEAGADAIGLNFYAPSPRCVDVKRAERIVDATPQGLAKVGVFVNSGVEEMTRIHDALGLDLIQLHGDEPPELLSALGERAVVRAFRCGKTGLDDLPQWLQTCERRGRRPEALLIDAFQPGKYGGTGRAFDWRLVDKVRGRLGGIKIAIAGGMRPDNVGEAIAAARPYAVDTASGVESAPGKKAPELVRAFVAAARAALDKLDNHCDG